MRIRSKITKTANSCETTKCTKNEKENLKWQKLNGRRYKEWMKSLVKAKESDPLIQKESLLSQVDVNISTSENETTDTNSSHSPSKSERLDFILRRVRLSGHVKTSNVPDLLDQIEVQKLDDVDEPKLQEKFVHPCGEEKKSTIPDFVEYWVPVRLSNIQIEQYCGSLFSKSTLLRSSYNFDDPRKFLYEILVSTKKCCDHPFLVDWSLHASLIEGIPQTEQLDAQINLSSKLLLFHKALLEIKKRGLRVLVLYQSLGGYGPITTGDILDDIIHEKFGGDSFVRIDGQISRAKRLAVLEVFNEKDGGKFVCLMETRACIPKMKLKSVDTVIFFNSDWNPTNDLKGLKKINLESQFEQVKIFRLYSAYTVEEKVLMLTRQGMAPEGNIRNIKQSTCHELLTWGAYYLFQKLDNFHANTTDTDEDSLMEDVFQELFTLLPSNDNSIIHAKTSLISEAQQTGGVYANSISLVGEVESPLTEHFSVIKEMLIKEPPYVFWINMLEGRAPRWKYLNSQPPRARNGVRSPGDLLDECVEPSKKCRTEGGGTTAYETSTTTRSKRKGRCTSGEAAALTLLDKSSSMELHSLSPSDDHDESPPQTTASKTIKDTRVREASQVTPDRVLESVCNALQTELERLENQKTEFSRQHEDRKLQTQMVYQKEVEEIHKKYEEILKNTDTAFLEEKQALDTRYNKLLVNKELAEALMQRDSKHESLSHVLRIKFSVEQAYRLLVSQSPKPSAVMRGEQVAIGSVASPAAARAEAGCLRAPAPHLKEVKHSPHFIVPKLPPESPRVTFSPVSLEQVMSPLPALLQR